MNKSADFENLVEVNSGVEYRQENRYTSIGIPLLYSPIRNSFIKDLGQKLLHAASIDMSLTGMAFDVNAPFQIGELVYLLIEKPETNNYEEINAVVRWSRMICENKYRVGVSIDVSVNSQNVPYKSAPLEFIPQFDIPQEIEIRCPACQVLSTFHFIVYQPVLIGRGLMPLYDCSACGTTRSLPGLLNNKS